MTITTRVDTLDTTQLTADEREVFELLADWMEQETNAALGIEIRANRTGGKENE